MKAIPTPPPPPAPPRTARQLAEDDRFLYGNGFVRRHSDGREEHIPADQVVIYPGGMGSTAPGGNESK